MRQIDRRLGLLFCGFLLLFSLALLRSFWLQGVLAGLNAVAFHFITVYTLVDWDAGGHPPFGARLAGALSIVLWANVIVCGRLIPYALTWFRE